MTSGAESLPTDVLLAALSNQRAFHWDRFGPASLGMAPRTADAVIQGREDVLREAALLDIASLGISGQRLDQAGSYLRYCESRGIDVILPYEQRFPPQLRHIGEPPFVLYVNGEKRHSTSGIGIVGSREPSEASLASAAAIARWLAKNKIPVVSGMAMGIDGAAIAACAGSGGPVVGVLPGDVESINPPRNREIYQVAGAAGMLVSETTPDCPVRQTSFLRRNRLISGFSRLLLAMSIRHVGGTFNQLVWAELQKRPFIVMEEGASASFKTEQGPKKRGFFFSSVADAYGHLSNAWIDPGYRPAVEASNAWF